MDSAGRSADRRATRTITVLFLLASSVLVCESQTSPRNSTDSSNFKTRIRELFEDARWQEIAEEISVRSATDPDLAFYYGSALAHLGREEDAREAFLVGRHVAPQDPRFPVELAGLAFKQKRYPESARWLRGALRTDPADAYANDFLGTVYFLQGNLEAALKYWNRVDKPRIESVRAEPPVRTHAVLLDHALTFAPASTLLLPDFRTSRNRVAGLGVFPSYKFQLAAREDAKFDVILNLQERNGWGNSKWEFLLSTFRGIPYQTVYLEYFNLRSSALNFTSLLRWDAQKRRLAADFSGPLHQDPKWRYRLGVDLRNENWAIRDSFTGPAPILGALNLRREAATAEITSFQSGRWDWSAGMELSHRDYRSVDVGTALSSQLLLEGMQVKQLARVRYDIWRAPEHRLVVGSGASSQLARVWSEPAEVFAKVQGSVSAHWFPQSEGEDYETYVQVRGGGTAGTSSFDELYMLGLERDNDLLLRAHIGTRDGRKGSAPLGDRFFLSNSEADKILYSNGLLTVKLGPFLDVGKIADHTANLGSSKWLWDTGLQAKLRVLGFGLMFTYGKDLRTGNNAFYFTTATR